MFATRNVDRDATLGARREQVAQADVGERAAHHDFVVATASAVGVEVDLLHAVSFQVLRGRAAARDVACGRDVIGGDRVAEHREGASPPNRLDLARSHAHAFEVRRVAHVGGLVVPRVQLARRNLDRTPQRIAREHITVTIAEHLRVDRFTDRVSDFLRTRPDVFEVDRLPVAARAERLGVEINVRGAGERIGDDERRRGEEVHLHFRMHTTLEVAVAREHRGGDDVTRLHGGRDLRLERARVADASHAAVARNVETDFRVLLEQLGLFQIVGHDLGAGREARLDPGLGGQAAARRVACNQCGTQHHGRIRRVGAAGDGSDQHGAILDLEAAWTGHAARAARCRILLAALFGHLRMSLAIHLLQLAHGHTILRALRTCE